MLLLVATITLLLLTLRSLFLISFRYNAGKRSFALKHSAIFVGAGAIAFLVLMVLAIGSVSHHVASDTEMIMGNISLTLTMGIIAISSIGVIIVFIKMVRALLKA